MDQGQIVCSFCSAEFIAPSGLNEAICPKCGKAMPLFNTKIGASQENGFGPPAEEEEIWDTVEDLQDKGSGDEPDAIGRIALKQVPANQIRPPQRTMMGQGSGSNPALSSLANTDQDGRLIPDVIHGEEGGNADTGPAPAKRPLESGFNLGPETDLSPEDDLGNESGVRPLEALSAAPPPLPPTSSGMPNLLDELDAELDGTLQEHDEEDIPEAEPLMEMEEEVSDFFESEQTPGLVLPDDGAISVSIPEAPIQERMRHKAVSMSSTNMAAPAPDGSKGSEDGKSTRQTSVTPELTPVLRSAIFIGLGVGVLLLVGLLYWLIQ